MPLTILHTAAHPADAFDMVGGTLAHHLQRGDRVCVVVFSHGVRSHALDVIEARRLHGDGGSTIEQAMDRKEREVVAACGILGIEDVRFLRYEDYMLCTDPAQVMALARIICEVKPDVLITHSPYEQAGLGCDHRICCDMTLRARAIASGLQKDGETPHRIGEVFYVWQHGETTSLDYAMPRFPEILIDVTDVVHLKVKALDCLASQFYPGGLARKILEDINGPHGVHMCVPYCETFMRHYPQVERYLPISEHNLQIVRQPLEETYRRMGRLLVPDVPFEPNHNI